MIRFGTRFASKPQAASLRFPTGMGSLVAQEVRELLADAYTPPAFPPVIQAAPRGVALKHASLRTLGELCLRLTTAKDLVWHLGDVRVMFENELMEAVERVPWQALLPPGTPLGLRISTVNSRLYHSGLIAECAAKALASAGVVVGEKGAGVTTLELTLRNDELALGLSLAGEPLNRRGLRQGLSHQAPLNECLAASVLRFAEAAALETVPELKGTVPQIHVPFAGSGTFGFEALLRFGRIAPCVFRESYAADALCCMPQSSLAYTRERARRSAAGRQLHICFSEIDPALCGLLRSYSQDLATRFERLGLEPPTIESTVGDFFALSGVPESAGPVCLLLNPPYGERLQVERDFFAALGRKVTELYRAGDRPVWGAALLPAGQPAAAFAAALRRSIVRQISLKNGGIAVKAVAFVLREGRGRITMT